MQPNFVIYSKEDIDRTKSLAWLSYLGILFLIPMLINKDSPYTKFHVNQGIVLCIADAVISAAAKVSEWIFIPFVGTILGVAAGAAGLALFIFAIIGIVNALSGKAQPLPLIGGIQIWK